MSRPAGLTSDPPASATSASTWWLVGYVVVAASNLVAETLHARVPAFVAVFFAMPVLIGFLWAARERPDRCTDLVTAALIMSWLGDWLGDLIAPHVIVKLGLFFVGHVCFVLAFWPYRRCSVLFRPPVLAAYVVIIGGLLAWIAVQTGIVAWLIVPYGALLGLMAVLATGLDWRAALGGIGFVASDLSIALTVFVVPGRFDQAELLIMSTYLVAQLLIVVGVLRRDPPRASSEDSRGGQRRATMGQTSRGLP